MKGKELKSKIDSTLRAAGFKPVSAASMLAGKTGGHYAIWEYKDWASVECCYAPDQMNAMAFALINAGLSVQRKHNDVMIVTAKAERKATR
jgi:hypothetical protein